MIRQAVPPHRAWPAAKLSLESECIVLDLSARDGSGAIRELHERVCRSHTVRDPAILLEDLLERHALGADCMDGEIAIPHARTLAVDDFALAIGRSAAGIGFDADHRSIRLVVLVGAPAAAVQEYLQCTVGLARRLRNPAVRRQLLGAATADEFRVIWDSAAPA